MKHCAWCDREINGWYLTYHGKHFCRSKDDSCIKNFLYEEADGDIEMDKDMDDEYRMDYVRWMEDRGFE